MSLVQPFCEERQSKEKRCLMAHKLFSNVLAFLDVCRGRLAQGGHHSLGFLRFVLGCVL